VNLSIHTALHEEDTTEGSHAANAQKDQEKLLRPSLIIDAQCTDASF